MGLQGFSESIEECEKGFVLSLLCTLIKHSTKCEDKLRKRKTRMACVSVSAYPVFICVAIFLCEEYQITRYKPYKVRLDVI